MGWRRRLAGLGALGAGAAGVLWAADTRVIEDVLPPEGYPVREVHHNRPVIHPTWTPPTRAAQLKALKQEKFDVLVVGGGATGSGVALDCATRGLKVALIERDDFASGTSSRSTKLIHGGIRYLAQAFQTKIPPESPMDVLRNLTFNPEYLRIVSDDLHERAFMIQSAPFMTRPVPMMIPLYRWWELPIMRVTGLLYDLVAGRRRTVPPSTYIPASEALYQFPSLKPADSKGDSLKGCLVVYDGQQNDTRMNIAIALTAAQNSATVVNHCEVTKLIMDGKPSDPGYSIRGATVCDTMTGEVIDVRADAVINACGVFSDRLRTMADPKATPIMIPGPGTHLILPDYASPDAMGLVWFTRDGRVLYLLPWEGSTIAGTTDSPGDLTFDPRATEDDVRFILAEVNRVLRDKLDRSSVRAAWCGLRPLVRDPTAEPSDTKKLSRHHVVDVVDGGFVTIAGGKWTTYRKMAEDAVDKAIEIHPNLANRVTSDCVTSSMKLIGADRGGRVCHRNFDRVAIALREVYGMDKDVANHLVHNYGTRALQLAEMAISEPGDPFRIESGGPRHWCRLSPQYPQLVAEVIFAVRYEYAETVVDIIARRTRLGFLDVKATLEILPRVLDLMQKELGWSADRRDAEQADARRFLESMYLPMTEADNEATRNLEERLLY